MFCHINEEDEGREMNCAVKMISEIISFLSMIFSIFVIVITLKKTKMNVINKLIIQILISEVLDGLNILLVIYDDHYGSSTFENYNSKAFICYTQVFIGIFTCLWTLFASFFIALRIYDIMVKKNSIFKNKLIEKYILFICFSVPMFISYVFWLIQTYRQSNKIHNLSKNKYYQKKHEHDHIKHMYCWLKSDINYALLVLVFILIGANIYLSIFKGSSFLKKISVELKDAQEKYEDQDNKLQKKIDNMEHIQKSLWIYPIVSSILWASFFILQIFFNKRTNHHILLSLLYCLIISVRQIIYTLIFLYTQKDIQYQFLKVVLCKNRRRTKLRNTTYIINEVKKNKGNLMLPDEQKIM